MRVSASEGGRHRAGIEIFDVVSFCQVNNTWDVGTVVSLRWGQRLVRQRWCGSGLVLPGQQLR